MLTTKLAKTYYYCRVVYLHGIPVGHILEGKMGVVHGKPYGLHYFFKPTVAAGHPLYVFGKTAKTVKGLIAILTPYVAGVAA